MYCSAKAALQAHALHAAGGVKDHAITAQLSKDMMLHVIGRLVLESLQARPVDPSFLPPASTAGLALVWVVEAFPVCREVMSKREGWHCPPFSSCALAILLRVSPAKSSPPL